jgi:transposase InsO family protein
MSWKEVNKVEQRKRFILRLLSGEKMAELCREYEISRKTGYKFLDRYQDQGFEGLIDRSRRPYRSFHKVNEYLEECVLTLKRKHISWGPKKLRAKLLEAHPGIHIPASSTIGMILGRHGLVKHRQRRIQRSYYPTQLADSTGPNEIWCIDFKGHFRTGDGKYCYPLTVTDHWSRYILVCEALENTKQDSVYPLLKLCFQKYGLPKRIRSDNGAPFACVTAPFGLTKLAVWLLGAGIELERIEPGHPEQNGRHERMHRTLKAETLRPAAKNAMQQQEKFDAFVKIFNEERPHEALNQKPPIQLYSKSESTFQEPVVLQYPLHDCTRKVSHNGSIRLHDQEVIISSAFDGQLLGLRDIDTKWLVSYANYDIGYIHKGSHKFESSEYLDA